MIIIFKTLKSDFQFSVSPVGLNQSLVVEVETLCQCSCDIPGSIFSRFCYVLVYLFCYVCFILFCFVLFCFILFCFVLFCFVLVYLFCYDFLFYFVLFLLVLFVSARCKSANMEVIFQVRHFLSVFYWKFLCLSL